MGTAAAEHHEVEYPETDEMGEHEVQWFVTKLLADPIARHLAHRMVVAHVAGNQFFYWRQGDPRAARAPDLYVLLGVAQDIPYVGAWRTWEGHRPAFALEIASGTTWRKDYEQAPADYAAMGCKELVIFDPGATPRSRRRVRWQVFRSMRGRGFVRVEATMAVAVRSTVLDAWLRVTREGARERLALATGARGETLVPTDAELVQAERAIRTVAEAQVNAERVIRTIAEAQVDAERAGRLSAEETARNNAQRAEAEAQRAEAEAQRAEALAAKLRALGIDPDAK